MNSKIYCSIVLTATLSTLPFFPSYARSPLTDSTDVQISPFLEHESSVFVSPLNPNVLLVGNNNPGQVTAWFSIDGGISWSTNGSFSGAGDPAVVISGDSLLSSDGRLLVNHLDGQANVGQIVEWKNNVTDNWTTTLVFPVNSIVTDKNHLWVDNSILSPVERRYNLYCGWSHGFATGTPTIRMARSLDGGETWEPQVPIIHTDSDDMFHGGVNIQTGRTGRVYAMWSIRRIPNPDPITVSFGFSESNDGGVTFSNQKILLANGVHDVAGNPVRGAQTWPSMTVDRSNPAGDSLYVVWADITPINGRDILMMKGFADADLSPVVWDESTIITVNQDVGNNKQWWPWITWDECTGMLAVVFMDSRVVEGQSKARTFVAVTADGGSSWTETRVSEGAGDPDAVGYDYIGIAAGDGRVFPVWSDDRTGAGDFRPYTSPLLLWGIEQPSVNDAVITNINGTISVVAWWSTNINSDDSVQIQLTSPTDQVYGCDPSTNCNTSMGGGTNHALILDVPCELGTWKYTVTSTRNGCIQPRTSDEKTFKILNCLN